MTTERMQRRNFLRAALVGAVFFDDSTGKIGIGPLAAADAAQKLGRFFETPRPNGAALSARPTANDRLDVDELRPGDVLATRWADERQNSTPGYWNHLAILGANATRIVEAQESADGPIATPLDAFLRRYAEIAVARYFRSEIAADAARFAESRVVRRTIPTPPRWEDGKNGANEQNKEKNFQKKRVKNGLFEPIETFDGPNYSRFASLALRVGVDSTVENCVSLVRRAFFAASGVDYRWRTPDSLFLADRVGDFRVLGRVAPEPKSR